MSQLDEKLITTTNKEGLIRAQSRLENSSTLRLQESYARGKANALDYWAQENGQVRGKQVCRLAETAQETPTTAYGSTAKFAGSSRISSILEYSYSQVWATAVQAEPKNTPRRPGSNSSHAQQREWLTWNSKLKIIIIIIIIIYTYIAPFS